MPVIWGFDLSEMKWSAFSSKEMFDSRWHLRRERFVLYQLAMLICLAAECTATYSLSKYEDLQTHVQMYANERGSFPNFHNNDLIDAEIVTIIFCVLVATIFGTDFFFLLFFPRRMYPRWYNIARITAASICAIGTFVAAIVSTVIVAKHSAYITGATQQQQDEYTSVFYRPPLKYNTWPTNIAYVVLLWIGWVCTVASTAIMVIAVRHEEQYGTAPRSGSTATTDDMTERLPKSSAA